MVKGTEADPLSTSWWIRLFGAPLQSRIKEG